MSLWKRKVAGCAGRVEHRRSVRVGAIAIALVVAWSSGAAGIAAADDEAMTDAGADLIDEIDDYAATYGIATDEKNWRLIIPPPPPLELDPALSYYWVLETSAGTLEFELYPDIAPNHVLNVLYLSHIGFYDGLHFYRIVKGLIAQAGSSMDKAGIKPVYTFDHEYTDDDRGKHDRAGVLSMANQNKPGTDGTEFFVTFKKLSKLDGKHTVFGRVVPGGGGKKVLKALSSAGTETGKPRKKIEIESATVKIRARGKS